MADKKKIFNESDFDKDKQLFTSKDFEKEKDVPKDSKPEPPHPDGGEGNGSKKSGKSKIFGGIAATVIAGLLCYSYFSSSDEQQDDGSTTQVEEVSGASNEEDNKDTSNVETTGTPETETANSGDSANDEGVTAPEQDVTSAEATSPQSKSKQDGATKPTTLSGSLEEKAKEVIRGNYGNGEVRKQKLGEQYSEIQSKVNEMYRNGQVQ